MFLKIDEHYINLDNVIDVKFTIKKLFPNDSYVDITTAVSVEDSESWIHPLSFHFKGETALAIKRFFDTRSSLVYDIIESNE